MIAKQNVYKTFDGRAVPEGDKDARFLLCRAGAEVNEKLLEQFDGAAALANSSAKKTASDPLPPHPSTVENNDPEPENRDPVPVAKKSKGRPKKATAEPPKDSFEY